MAQRPSRQVNRNSRYVSGNLAYDYDYLERERQRRAEREMREYAERRARETAPHPAQRKKEAARPKHRELQRVSPLILLGFAAAAAMVVMLLTSYAQLNTIASEVVGEQRQLAALEEEHVALVARYEKTFDLAAIKEAAEAAGMAKPSASQIYYVDLSTPDNVVLYSKAQPNVFSRAITSVSKGLVSIVEYFK